MAQKASPTSLHFDRIVRSCFALPLHSQRAHAGERAGAIRASRIVLQSRRTFGNSRKHRVAMRYGFISRQLHAAADVARRTHQRLRISFHRLINITDGESNRRKNNNCRPKIFDSSERISTREPWPRRGPLAKCPAELLSSRRQTRTWEFLCRVPSARLPSAGE